MSDRAHQLRRSAPPAHQHPVRRDSRAGHLALADESKPSDLVILVQTTVEGVASEPGQVTFADDYVFDVPIDADEREISFEITQPDDAEFGDNGRLIFVNAVFLAP